MPGAGDPCAAGCPGLRGEYFDNDDFTGRKLVRTDRLVDFIWESNAPDPSMGADSFSVRWSGRIRPPFSETTTFVIEANDNVRLTIGGRKLLDVFDNDGRRTSSAAIDLVAGQSLDISIEYRERTGDAQIRLFWRSASQPQQAVPTSALSWVGAGP